MFCGSKWCYNILYLPVSELKIHEMNWNYDINEMDTFFYVL